MNTTFPAADREPWASGRPDDFADTNGASLPVAFRSGGQPQSLADGLLGEALLAVELALTGDGSWDEVTDVLLKAQDGRADDHLPAGLFYGLPALAFVLDATGVEVRARYAHALGDLDREVEVLTRERLAVASERRAAGAAARAGEFDLFSGLIGLGTLLLRRAPRSRTVGEVLAYVVDLTRDRTLDEVRVPGWWTNPDPFAPEEGHADLGMAQGAAGLLAFLATAVHAGHDADVPSGAIKSLVGWLKDWRQDGPDGVWWPERLALDELRTGTTNQTEPSVPTWAYGTVGIGRALQMAAIATGDKTGLQADAEAAIVSCLTPARLTPLTEPDLFTGAAGLYQTAFRAAQDASSSMLPHRLATAADVLSRTGRGWPENTALLTGRAGTRLANQTLLRRAEPVSGWDRCLLIAWAHA